MEFAGFVVQVVQCMSPSIAQRWEDHRNIYRNMDNLKQKLEELNSLKTDIVSKLETEVVQGKTELKEQVKKWLERVEDINEEVNAIEEEVRLVKFFARASLGKKVSQKVEEVEELNGKGTFSEGLVISLPSHGDLLPTTATIAGETYKRKMEEIWACLLDNEVRKIGVYGMGGIGKTTALEHIHNRVLQEQKERFDNVIWVTASKDSNVTNLQDKIASKLGLCISDDNDQITRAAKLLAEFGRKKKYVLILDDLWDAYSLKDIGIPEPSSGNGCKLVLSTRSRDVCRRMSCNEIPIELLSKEEALKLFLEIVGHEIFSDPNLKEIVVKVVQECACLPLAVVTIAGSLKGIVHQDEWEIALEDLMESTKGSTSDGIFERLKFSYDRLNDRKLQDCLLYCALYPEDYEIERYLLIEHLVAEGIIEERRTRQSEIQKGQVMLNKLVDVCLLSDTLDKCVRLHDLVRDMALQIVSDQAPQFLVKAGMRLKDIPAEEKWKRDLVRASLMNNDISDIPSDIEPPNCPQLLTLFFSENIHLRSIPDHFFHHMKRLSVLDLSNNTSLRNIPESVSDLVCLTALFLRHCRELIYVPSLAKLKELRKLDFCGSGIKELPRGMEMLTKLTYLNFSETCIEVVSERILCNLSNLQYLSIMHFGLAPKGAEKLELRKLETFEGIFYDINSLNAYAKSLEHSTPSSYILQLRGAAKKFDKVFHEGNKFVVLYNCDIRESVAEGGECPLLLPKDIEVLQIEHCAVNASNLCELASFNNVTNLRQCILRWSCDKMEHVFSYSTSIFPLLQSLEKLLLVELPNLRGLIFREAGISSPLPPATFSSLNYLSISGCDKIEEVSIVASLPNLEELYFAFCKQLKEVIIIPTTSDEDKKGGDDIKVVTLPKLRICKLWILPKLHSIPLVADSLQEIIAGDCPNLKRLPMLDIPCPPPLQRAAIYDSVWKSLEWDHPNAKEFVQSLR